MVMSDGMPQAVQEIPEILFEEFRNKAFDINKVFDIVRWDAGFGDLKAASGLKGAASVMILTTNQERRITSLEVFHGIMTDNCREHLDRLGTAFLTILVFPNERQYANWGDEVLSVRLDLFFNFLNAYRVAELISRAAELGEKLLWR